MHVRKAEQKKPQMEYYSDGLAKWELIIVLTREAFPVGIRNFAY